MIWFNNLSLGNKIALLTFIVTFFGFVFAFFTNSSTVITGNKVSISGNANINGEIIAGNKITNNGIKGTNYIEGNPKKETMVIFKEYLPTKDGEFKYSVNLKGKVEITDNFKPFRIEMFGNDPMVYAYKKTIDSSIPFYQHDQEIIIEWFGSMKPVYDVPADETGSKFYYGYPLMIQITNITDYGEDIVLHNTLISEIKRLANAKRIVAAFGYGGGENFIKLKRKIPLREGKNKIKFKSMDFITLRSGESIILEIPYLAEETGLFQPEISLSFKYAGAEGKLKITPPKIVVPKLICWIDPLMGMSNLNVMSTTTIMHKENMITLWDNRLKKYKPFNLSNESLSKEDMIFIGRKNLSLYRNEIYAKKGAIFKSKELASYFKDKLKDQFNPYRATNEILESELTKNEIENIKKAIALEKILD